MTGWPAAPCAHEWVGAHATATPEAPAIGTPLHGWRTYAELHADIQRAAACHAAAGLGPGGFVVQAVPPSAIAVAMGLGAQSLGATLVEINRELGAATFGEIVRQTGARSAVVYGRDVPTWAPLAAEHGLHLFVVHDGDPPARMASLLDATSWIWIPEGGPVPGAAGEPASSVDPATIALLVYTSGSTGTPRAVIQTHANVDANSRAIATYLDLTERDRAMATLPLFYCYGRSVLQTHLLVGGSVFFDHRFMYPKVVLDEMVAQRCTSFAGVPLTFENLKRQVDVAALDLSPLRYVTQAGGRMHPDTVAWARAAFAPAELFVMYGQTEATARLTYLPPAMAETKPGSVGVAVDGVELRIVDDAGAGVPTGTVGNVVARGPSITPGYFGAPAETAEILRDGWLWTGDVGRLDGDGYLFLTGRTKDFMKLGGNRVSPQEIEDVVARHPAVEAVAVGGASDATGAEYAIAFVVPRPGAVVDESDVRRFCREHLPAFKVPARVVTVDALPLTSSRKIARTAIQEWIRNDPSLLS